MSKESFDILAKGLTVAIYVLLAILIITFTAVGGIAGIPCVFGVPLIVVWLTVELFTLLAFKVPLLGFSLFGAVTGLLTLGNWIYDKLSINPKKMVEVTDENQNLVETKEQTETLAENKNLNVFTEKSLKVSTVYAPINNNSFFINTNSNMQEVPHNILKTFSPN